MTEAIATTLPKATAPSHASESAPTSSSAMRMGAYRSLTPVTSLTATYPAAWLRRHSTPRSAKYERNSASANSRTNIGLRDGELAAYQFCTPGEAKKRLRPYVARLNHAIAVATVGSPISHLHHGADPAI